MIILITAAILIAAGICDAKSKRIPNLLILLMLATGIINIIVLKDNITDKLIGFVFPSALLLLARILGTSIGAGDIKLVSCLGLICGAATNSIVFIIGCIFAVIFYCLYTVITKNKPKSLAFAPFITASFIVLMLILMILR